MNTLLMILRAPRPSHRDHMQVVVKPHWIRRGYDALTLFGTIITHNQQDADAFRDTSVLYNHERIHLYQARSCHDSWWLFYLRYAYYWFAALPHTHHFRDAGYRLNPFEMEAYANQHNLHYLDDKQAGANQWRTYARMSLRERRQALGTIKSAALTQPSQCQTVHPSEHHLPQTVSPSE